MHSVVFKRLTQQKSCLQMIWLSEGFGILLDGLNSIFEMTQKKRIWPVVKIKMSQFSLVKPLSRVQLFATPWTATHQTSLSITNSKCLTWV